MVESTGSILKDRKPIQFDLRNKQSKNSSAHRLKRWFERNVLKIDAYELRVDEVVSLRTRASVFNINDVYTWQQLFICIGVPYIEIILTGGQKLELSDKHEDLRYVLQAVAASNELPWNAI